MNTKLMTPSRRIVSRGVAFIAAATSVGVVLAACSSGSSSTSSKPTDSSNSADSSSAAATGGGDSALVAAAQKVVDQFTAAPTTIPQNVPLVRAPDKGKKMFYISDPNPANLENGAAVQQAVTAAGWSYKRLTYDIANPSSLQAALTNALDQGANYVTMAGTDATTISASVVAAYRKAGAHIIIGSSAPNHNSDVFNTDAASGPDRENQANVLANWFIADSKGKGKAIFSNVTAYPVLALLANTFKTDVEAKCPDCSVQIAGFTPADLQSNSIVPGLVAKLRSNPSYKYLLFDYSAFATGIDSAIAASGLKGIKVGGAGVDVNTLKALKSGTDAAWIANNYYYWGYGMADVAFRLDTGTKDGFTQIQTAPIQLITKANADTVKLDFNLPGDALQQLEKLWKIGS